MQKFLFYNVLFPISQIQSNPQSAAYVILSFSNSTGTNPHSRLSGWTKKEDFFPTKEALPIKKSSVRLKNNTRTSCMTFESKNNTVEATICHLLETCQRQCVSFMRKMVHKQKSHSKNIMWKVKLTFSSSISWTILALPTSVSEGTQLGAGPCSKSHFWDSSDVHIWRKRQPSQNSNGKSIQPIQKG